MPSTRRSRANFAVAETRVGQRTDYDRLTLTVETNGTMTPEEAVSYAAALAQTHFQYFVSFGSHVGRRRRRAGAEGSSTPLRSRSCSAPRSTTWSCPSAR
jgi:DNA-directed RNA polymerase subunit alpha